MIDQILSTVGSLLGWIPVPVQDSRIANVIRATAAGLALYGAYSVFGGN